MIHPNNPGTSILIDLCGNLVIYTHVEITFNFKHLQQKMTFRRSIFPITEVYQYLYIR